MGIVWIAEAVGGSLATGHRATTEWQPRCSFVISHKAAVGNFDYDQVNALSLIRNGIAQSPAP